VFFTQKEPEVPLKEESEQVIETEEDIVTEEEAPPYEQEKELTP